MLRLPIGRARSVIVLGVVSLSACLVQAGGNPLKSVKEWNGKFGDNAELPLMKEAPRRGYLVTPEELAKLWKTWRGKETPPKIDFAKEFVFVHTASGPNVITMEFRLSDKGDLKTRFIATERGGPGFVYKIATLKREGIKTINGKEVAAAPLNEAQVRLRAAAFANDALKGKTYRDAAGKEHAFPIIAPAHWIYAEQKEDRWRLGINPPSGVTVVVSFNLDGSDPKLEQASFASL